MPQKCEHCGEYLATKCSLKSHQETAQYCLNIQKRKGLEPKYTEYKCDCGHVFTLKRNFTRHKTRCKFIPSSLSENQTITAINERSISIVNNTINTVNNTVNNILIDVHPFTINQLTADDIVSKLTPVITKEVMKLGINSITELIIELLLKNDGKYCYWCTDKSRKQFKMLISSDGEVSIRDDPNALNLRTIMSFPLKTITLPFAAEKNAAKTAVETYEEIRNLKLEGSSFISALASALPKTPDGIDPQIKAKAELEASNPEKLELIARLEKQLDANQRRKRMIAMGFDSDYSFE